MKGNQCVYSPTTNSDLLVNGYKNFKARIIIFIFKMKAKNPKPHSEERRDVLIQSQTVCKYKPRDHENKYLQQT